MVVYHFCSVHSDTIFSNSLFRQKIFIF
jgi:hypothetical protein